MKAIILILMLALPIVTNARDFTILIWEEYLAPQVVEAFEQRFEVNVQQINYTSEGEILPLLEKHSNRVDLLVAANSSTIHHLNQEARLLPLDMEKLPATRAIHSVLQQNGGYAVPYMWGTTGIAWKNTAQSSPPRSWVEMVAQIRQKPGTIGVINDAVEALLLVHFAEGNTQPFKTRKEVEKAVRLARPLLASAVANDSEMSEENPLLTGELTAIQTWSGDAAYLRDSFDAAIRYQVPEQGCMIWQDAFAIPATSTRPDLAHEFINYITSARVAARNAEYLRFAPSNPLALAHVSLDFLSDPIIHPSFEGLDHCHPYTAFDKDIQEVIDAFQQEMGW